MEVFEVKKNINNEFIEGMKELFKEANDSDLFIIFMILTNEIEYRGYDI